MFNTRVEVDSPVGIIGCDIIEQFPGGGWFLRYAGQNGYKVYESRELAIQAAGVLLNVLARGGKEE